MKSTKKYKLPCLSVLLYASTVFNSSILKIKKFKCKMFHPRSHNKQKAEQGLGPSYFAFHKPSLSFLPHWLF